jgi:hypothetical protein
MSSQPDEIEDEWLRYRAEQIAYQERLEWEAQALVPGEWVKTRPGTVAGRDTHASGLMDQRRVDRPAQRAGKGPDMPAAA